MKPNTRTFFAGAALGVVSESAHFSLPITVVLACRTLKQECAHIDAIRTQDFEAQRESMGFALFHVGFLIGLATTVVLPGQQEKYS